MKCALIIPPWLPEEIFSSKTAGSQINYWQPLGTLYVAAALQQAGHEVRFLNGAFLPHQEIMAGVAEFAPEFIGLYSTTFGWDKAKKMATALRQAGFNGALAVGGPFPIALPEKCLTECPELDVVVTGEGEETVVELLEMLAGSPVTTDGGNGDRPWPDLGDIKGLAWRRGQEIVLNPPRPLITDLDALPFPARELLGEIDDYVPPPATYKRRPVAVIITSRGCNRHCLYCFQIDKSRKSGIRYRSVDNVMAEIRHCLAQGYREIKFIDDTLAADYQRAMELARRIKEEQLDFTWFASACVNQVDLPLLKAFKEAGCWAILFGAESGVQKDLNTIRKGITPGQIKKAVAAAKEAGITVYTPFIFGIPGQTFEDGLKSIEFALELDPDIANFHALTPFPGTELWDNLDQYGTVSHDLSEYTYQGAAFIPYSMTREEIAELRRLAFKRFYSRPKFLWRRLLALRSIHDLKAAVNGAKSLFWLLIGDRIFHRSKDK
ncbi:B12-binding domain-containing radical SAM protein [Desulfurivibrio alkaliphilus]|uniref:Radical SAM domain protein n=1 Tax=Desulfurivibrio alkaliphilus (strain DSM 19089 / UNIQEM U267 / AHT2) TaxID=589865 RepID=D6Z043_DESAT|nr:radical SAM protein [Desulfurivibrio alkaliphilus]ADH87076.1 Radical SAM domain protein [Desulfurivibrio alkaliphilus AHT 2]